MVLGMFFNCGLLVGAGSGYGRSGSHAAINVPARQERMHGLHGLLIQAHPALRL